MPGPSSRSNTPPPQEPRRPRLARLRESGWDLALTLAQVLAFFLVFMGILLLSFPKGTGLNDLYGDLVERRQGRAARHIQDAAGPATEVAVLASTSRTVKDRPADAVAWRAAQPGMPLGDQHAIQTLDRSTASIVFNANNVLQMGENSLVIVRQTDRRRRDRTASLVVLGGRVRGRVQPGQPHDQPLQLVAGNASSVIRPQADQPAEYELTVNPDSSTTVSVFSGEAEITSGNRTAKIQPNQSLTVRPDQPLGRPDWIPQPATPLEPQDNQQLTFGTTPPQVRFRWQPSERADSYRLVIARDFEFNDVVFETRAESNQATYGNLRAGSYFWRVDGLNGKARSLPGTAHRLLIQRDDTPPNLQVNLPETVVEDQQLTVRGQTDPEVRITIANHSVDVDADGQFEFTLDLRPGPNLVVVEAIDPAGNVAYHSQYVNAKF